MAIGMGDVGVLKGRIIDCLSVGLVTFLFMGMDSFERPSGEEKQHSWVLFSRS